MKLYTEEQVRQMLEVCIDSDLYEHILTFRDIFKTQTPIELPTDEEIQNASLEDNNDDLSPAEEFQQGAKWMRNKIQGDNK
jgi:hypothetical protein